MRAVNVVRLANKVIYDSYLLSSMLMRILRSLQMDEKSDSGIPTSCIRSRWWIWILLEHERDE